MRFHRILVPTDFSPGADAAFDAAIELARTVDLVVLGTQGGRRGLTHALLGSVAEKVVRMCPVSVLTVRPPAEEAGSAPQG
jgi:nucleotide-binding universal stress UspA family protein